MKMILRSVVLATTLLLSAGLSAVLFAWWRFSRLVKSDVEALLARSASDSDSVVTEAMLANLPAPVRRYLRYTGIVGKPIVQMVYVEQCGKMRSSEEAAWTSFDAKQHFSIQPPGFVWDATMRMLGLPVVRIRDRYLNGAGEMLGKLGALVTVVHGTGEEMDQGTMLRYLSEMQWFPSAFLRNNVAFEPIDDASARVTLTDGGRSVTGTMYFDDAGRLTNFTAERYAMVDGDYELRRWSTPVKEYGEFEGLKLPIRSNVIWTLQSGDFTWLDLTITRVEYNVIKAWPQETTHS